ncbi:hypothetical protein Acid345_2751 [Candidatus Koribacter versatilis Ellin345]|uniref:Uncharacterized protein n=2 Tax=Candidatus Korobacter versatilis TaxID=658062 RepID=Q1IMZ8_KORVE|nr:hypothetical protein Acid345_2751 [Candidatus Koribacter versatilis Ellin345]
MAPPGMATRCRTQCCGPVNDTLCEAAIQHGVRMPLPFIYARGTFAVRRVRRGTSMKIRRLLYPAMLLLIVLGLSGLSFAQFGVSISIGVAPPPLPVYDQPPIPAVGYIWTPGFWAWSDDGYYWVPGTWVQPPEVGLLWTPGYWGWNDDQSAFAWNDGYWGPEVGFYGGVDYGYGYTPDGYYGGEWRGRDFYYNRAVNNVTSVHITNVYEKQVVTHTTVERVSYNGPGGAQAKPTPKQVQAKQQKKVDVTPVQKQHVQAAKSNPQLLAKNNNGKPPVAATSKPGDMSHAVQAKAAGGKIDPKVLQANAKTAPKTAKPAARPEANAAKQPAKPAETGKAAETSKATEANKPAAETGKASASSKPSTEPSKSTERTATKPASGAENSGARAKQTEPATPRPAAKESGSSAGMPQSEGAGHRAEPAGKAAEPKAQPAEHAPAAKEKAAQPETNKQKPEKAKPASEKDKPEEPK